MKFLNTILALLVLSVPAVPATITRDDLKKTLEHIQSIAKQQATELDSAKAELNEAQTEIRITRENLKLSKQETTSLEKKISDLNEYADKMVAEARAAKEELSTEKAAHKKTLSKYHTLKTYAGITLALLASYISFSLLGLLPIYYRVAATAAIGVAIFSATFCIF